MKNYLIGFMVCMIVILAFGANVDRRNQEPYTKKIFVREVATLTVPDDGQATEQTTDILINGHVRQIVVTINNNDGNATATVALRNEDGAVLWTESGVAENTSTVFQYYTLSGTDLPLDILCAGTITVGCTASGDPGSSGLTCDVELYGD